MKKLKALITAEVISEMLERDLSQYIDFKYAGYYYNHDVLEHGELVRIVSDIDILVCEYDTISEDVFEAAKNLKIIICCRGGVKTVIDIDKAMEKGIDICNNAGRNAGAVSDIVMGYILNLTRNITLTNELIHNRVITTDVETKPKEYRDTVWGLDNNSPFIKYRGRSINHMTLGIVGYGNAGRSLAQKANAFGMKIIAYDPYSDFEGKPDYVEAVKMDTLLEQSDIISLHCVLTPQTRNMFNKEMCDKMKEGSYFINTARGELVDEDALISNLKSGHLAGAAIDVTRVEPIASDSPLLEAPNLIITPHIGGSANDVQYCGTNMVIESLTDFINGDKPRNAIVYK